MSDDHKSLLYSQRTQSYCKSERINSTVQQSSTKQSYDSNKSLSIRRSWITMNYAMEDTQNSAPGQPTAHEASKLSSTTRRNDTQSVTKR